MSPFRELLKSKNRLYWDETLEQLFQPSEAKILNSIQNGVRTFEINRPACLTTDWSQTGIGFILFQKHCEYPFTANNHCGPGYWRVVNASSQFTRPAESRYAGDALVIKFDLESCRMFLLGCPHLILAIDHKPPVLIFNDCSLNEIKNPRILDIREQTLM